MSDWDWSQPSTGGSGRITDAATAEDALFAWSQEYGQIPVGVQLTPVREETILDRDEIPMAGDINPGSPAYVGDEAAELIASSVEHR
ncbi:MAG: hypothetical protein K0S65_3227 [Labilithrix sp.]|nr:hypothetical protein [Labilithrix sp.]